jgi:hypothetical protein
LLHPLFLLSLVLLLLNDFYFKYQFHNWLTGKASDFAGLFTFSIFFITIFPSHKKKVIILIALFFTWWKSPLSEFLINFLNLRLNAPFTRVIDYSDLFALTILPLSLCLNPVRQPETTLRKFATVCILTISFTAFTATSLPKKITDDNKVKLDKYIKTKKKESTIIKNLQNYGLHPVETDIYEKIGYANYYLKQKDTSLMMIIVDSLYSGVYRKINHGSSYTIPKLYVAGDSVSNLQLVITNYNQTNKTEIWLHSFEYKTAGTDSDSLSNVSSFYLWKKFKNPIKRKIKEILSK